MLILSKDIDCVNDFSPSVTQLFHIYNLLICLQIDPKILGGLVVEFGQKVFDMSIKTRAAQMERFLRQPINLDGH